MSQEISSLVDKNSYTICLVVALLCVLLVAACTKSSKPDEVISDRGYPISFDEAFYVIVEASLEDAWTRARLALEDLEWPIDTEVEASGLVTTDVVTIGTNRDRYACRRWVGSRTRVDAMRCKLVIRVTPVDDMTTKVRVRADIEGRYVFWNSRGEEQVGGWWQCTSTGAIESELFDAFLTRFEPVRYDPPLFRRGAR